MRYLGLFILVYHCHLEKIAYCGPLEIRYSPVGKRCGEAIFSKCVLLTHSVTPVYL